jgi:hypothetical protein
VPPVELVWLFGTFACRSKQQTLFDFYRIFWVPLGEMLTEMEHNGVKATEPDASAMQRDAHRVAQTHAPEPATKETSTPNAATGLFPLCGPCGPSAASWWP